MRESGVTLALASPLLLPGLFGKPFVHQVLLVICAAFARVFKQWTRVSLYFFFFRNNCLDFLEVLKVIENYFTHISLVYGKRRSKEEMYPCIPLSLLIGSGQSVLNERTLPFQCFLSWVPQKSAMSQGFGCPLYSSGEKQRGSYGKVLIWMVSIRRYRI